MARILEHKGYLGSIEYSEDDNSFYGQIIGIEELIVYSGSSIEELKSSFEQSVENLLMDIEN